MTKRGETLEFAVLGLLHETPMHGYELRKRLNTMLGWGRVLSYGSLYPALYRLEEAGEVKAAWETESHGRRGARRRIYTLTVKGRRTLDAGRADWQQFVRILGGILGAPA